MKCFDIGNICYPFLIRSVSAEISIQQIWITVQRISVMLVFSATYYSKKVIFTHNTKNCFWILMHALPFQPDMYSAVSISVAALLLTLLYRLLQRQIFGRSIKSVYKIVIATSGHFEEATHFTDRITILVTLDYLIFYRGFHSFPISERKSRSS